jgi:hypothetical protein
MFYAVCFLSLWGGLFLHVSFLSFCSPAFLHDFSCCREIFVRNRGMMQKQRTGATVNVQCLDASEVLLPVIRGCNVQWHACRLLKAEVLVPFGLRSLSILFSCWCFLHRFSVLSRHTIEALEKEITFQISVGLFSVEVLKSVVTGQSGFNFTCGCRCRRQVIWIWFSSYSFWMMLFFFFFLLGISKSNMPSVWIHAGLQEVWWRADLPSMS